MDVKTILVLTVASLDILLGLIVFLQDRRSSINRAYSFFALSVAIWGFGVGFFLLSHEQVYADFFARLLYFGGGLIPAAFYYFSLVFYSERPISFLLRFIIFLPSALFLVLYFFTDAIIAGSYTQGGVRGFQYGDFRHLFDLHLWVIFALAFKELLVKYKTAPRSDLKLHTLFIILGTYSVLAVAAVTNIFAPLLSVYGLIWVGPSATIIWISIVTFAVIRHQIFNLKIIATQLLIFILWTFLLIRTLLSINSAEVVVNGLLCAVVVLLGLFLIRSVKEEVRSRERTERMAKDLKKANIRLRELDRQKSEFVSIASHQLKSPLTVIQGYASMLSDGSFGKIPEKAREAATRITQSGHSMVDVVEDFLDITRIEQGRMHYDLVRTEIGDIMRGVLDEMQQTFRDAGLALHSSLPASPVFVMGDAGKLRQVIVNLLDNAIKYTKGGVVDVGLAIAGEQAVISVRDTGIGIPKEFIPELFGKFSRAENGVKMHANGAGIGLFIVKEIVKAHGGRIWAESEGEGKGSTFFVELPSIT